MVGYSGFDIIEFNGTRTSLSSVKKHAERCKIGFFRNIAHNRLNTADKQKVYRE